MQWETVAGAVLLMCWRHFKSPGVVTVTWCSDGADGVTMGQWAEMHCVDLCKYR